MSGPLTRPFDEPLQMDEDVLPVKIEAKERSSVSSTVDNSKRVNEALPWVVIAIVATVACSMAGVSLGLSIASRDTANRAERETRLQRLEVDELKVALQVQGIKIHEGSTP